MTVDRPSIKTMIDQTMHEVASRYRCSLQDLRLVGRPELVYTLILAGEMPSRPVEIPGSRYVGRSGYMHEGKASSMPMHNSSMLCTFVVTSVIEERDIDGDRRSSDLMIIHRSILIDMETP